jgi:hypothetical protein
LCLLRFFAAISRRKKNRDKKAQEAQEAQDPGTISVAGVS